MDHLSQVGAQVGCDELCEAIEEVPSMLCERKLALFVFQLLALLAEHDESFLVICALQHLVHVLLLD